MDIVILGYRISGLDGVSLESVHWKNILERMGHKVTLIAGELDREGLLLTELHFKWPQVAGIHNRVVYGNEDYKKVEREIFTIAGKLEGKLREIFRNGKKFDLLIVPNVFSLPMHFPLAVALTRVIQEFDVKTIARHHDFWWERDRYKKSCMFHFFEHWFPPKLPQIKHVVINSIAKSQLHKKTGIKAEVIWDTFDFGENLNKKDSFNKNWRKDFGLNDNQKVFLQATRIVPRKRIEISISLLERLAIPDSVFVVSGKEGDEKPGYLKYLKNLAKQKKVKCFFIGKNVNSERKVLDGKRIYTIWDCYVNSDILLYPTKVEGFGNQFVESTYFKKPLILTEYEVYKKDIKPLGFKTIEITDDLNNIDFDALRKFIGDEKLVKEMVDRNFKLGKKYFSYDYVEKKLHKLLKKMNLE